MLLGFLIPFGIAVLSGLGVGSGGLLVIYLALFTDTPQLVAQGLNLLFFLFSSSASLTVSITRRTLYPMLIFLLALSGLLGAWLGSFLASRMNAMLLRKMFGVMLIVTGIVSLKRKPGSTTEKEKT